MEMWKPVLDFEELYEVSNFGNVRRIARSKTINAAKIPEAKQMFEHGATLKQVADFLDTSIPTAHSIKMGKTWAGSPAYRLVKPQLLKHYFVASLCKNSNYIRRSVHRMVWEAFNGRIEGRLEINHKDLNRTNNNLNNLELVTHQQNIKHAHNIYKLERTHLPKGQRSGPFGRYKNC